MIRRALNFNPGMLRFDGIIGTGGIGSGSFFVLNGDHTLGREESRSGRFLTINDYCKQHIILHYVKVLLGPDFDVKPVGKVGRDATGIRLVKEMSEAGFEMDLVDIQEGVPTLFSFCFYYPDGTGGNMTTDNSASSLVDAALIGKAGPATAKLGSRGIIMAAPEVALDARMRLIRMGKDHGLFCTASFTSGEIPEVKESGILSCIDLVAFNSDEAAAVAGLNADKTERKRLIESTVRILAEFNNKIMVSVTAGREGSWCWDGHTLNSFPAVKGEVVSTAGAGDAFFSGLISGTALGLHLFEAQQLASLVAGLSITSPDTINKDIDRSSLNRFLNRSGMDFSGIILKLMEE